MRFSVMCFLLCLVSTVFAEPVVKDKEFAMVVTKDNFKQSILEADKDVFIKFYAPWCGHCTNLAPTYEKLAEELSAEDVIVAKFDADAYEIPSLFNVRGYPTLYWLPKGAKNAPIAYKGGRSVDDFVKFIANHSTDGLKQFDVNGNKISKEEPIVKEEAAKDEKIAVDEDTKVKVDPASNEESAVKGAEKNTNVESVPEEPELVKEVVSGNMKQMVFGADVDVLIQFYAPWCGYCKKFDPVYEELAQQLIDEDLVVVKFGATANELDPLFETYGVPTIFFLRKDAKEWPLLYVGDRQPEDLLRFVAMHSTDGLKQFNRDGERKMGEPALAGSETLGQENTFDDEL